MTELKDVKVSLISLVPKGANGEPVQVYKSADQPPVEEPSVSETPQVETVEEPASESPEEPQAEETEVKVEKTEEQPDKSTVSFIKKFFAPMAAALGFTEPVTVEKSQDIPSTVDYTSFKSRMNNPRDLFERAMDNLTWSIYDVFWDDRVTNGKEIILQNIDDFKAYVSAVLNRSQDDQVVFFQKGVKDQVLKTEDLKTILSEVTAPITKSLEDLTNKITALEKVEETPATVPETEPVQKSDPEPAKVEEPDQTAILKAAITESLVPITKSISELTDRMSTLENLRGLPNGSQTQTQVQKAAAVDEWPGFNLPLI